MIIRKTIIMRKRTRTIITTIGKMIMITMKITIIRIKGRNIERNLIFFINNILISFLRNKK